MNERSLRIKRLVEESGRSYNELEKITGISRSTLQRYATGVTTKIPLDAVEKLEKAFGVQRGYIMGWDVKPSEAGALAANVLRDPDVFKFVKKFLELDEVDRYALGLVMESMELKKAQKKTDAKAPAVKESVVETE